MNRFSFRLGTLGVAVVISCALGNFSISNPSTGTIYNSNASIGLWGTCNGNEQGTVTLSYDGPNDPPVVWASINVTGMMSTWGGTLNVPTNPGYWQNTGAQVEADLKANPANGAAGEKKIKINDWPGP